MSPTTRRRSERSAAPSASPALVAHGSSRGSEAPSVDPLPPSAVAASTPGSGIDNVDEEGEDEEDADEQEESTDAEADGDADDDSATGAGGEAAEDAEDGEEEEEVAPAKPSREDRLAKLKELRTRMNESTMANRRELVADHQRQKVTHKEIQRLEKQRKIAQTMRLKEEAAANGEDVERQRNWKWSIEQNEQWMKKHEESEARKDSNFHNASDEAHKKYNKQIRTTKADLVAYNRQKEAALGLAPGTLVPLGATSDQVAAGSSSNALTAAEDLYRSADTLAYGDSKPSEEAIDRVVGQINKQMSNRTGKQRKREKGDDEDGDVTYINKRNKVFNEKVARYFDKYTKDIKASLERGTAL